VSDQNLSQPPQQTAGETASREIAETFKQAGKMHSQPRLRGIRGVCRFEIAGAGTWSIAANDGEATVIEGAGNGLHADCVVSCSAADFLRIVRGEHYLNLLTAAMQGLVTVSGDKIFALALLGNAVVAPVAASHRQ
jgi:putative sterol carrier protein